MHRMRDGGLMAATCPPGLSRLAWDGPANLGTHAHGATYGDRWEEGGPFRRACRGENLAAEADRAFLDDETAPKPAKVA